MPTGRFNEAVGYYRRNDGEREGRIPGKRSFNEAVGYYRRNGRTYQHSDGVPSKASMRPSGITDGMAYRRSKRR